ncbi:unnamed protein product [Paramecium pentaurelia]|uniref:Uncharacterized protein n=1 Tax=Paramecium pentaurelia TaxID=43138 RepID=A0A8S1XKH6_9CILI|nr:unnamed protein product [Paramecium pentaurelia]
MKNFSVFQGLILAYGQHNFEEYSFNEQISYFLQIQFYSNFQIHV